MSALDEVARFSSMSEAAVAQCYLRANGVEAVLAEENVYAALPIRLSRGGFRLLAARRDMHVAKLLLAEIRGKESSDDDDPLI